MTLHKTLSPAAAWSLAFAFACFQSCASTDSGTDAWVDPGFEAVGDAADDAADDATDDAADDVSDDAADDATDDATDDAADDAPIEPRVPPYACVIDPECSRVMVASHRGFHLSLPENSLAALRAAAAVGADFVEIDVRHTADDELVLMHDGSVDRTTDGRGDVNDLSWEQIQGLTLKNAPEGATDPEVLRVPTFEAALSLARELGIALYVDQKTDRTGLVLAVVRAGSYFDIAMIRDGIAPVADMAAQEPRLWVMPAVKNIADLEDAIDRIPDLRIAEVSKGDIDLNLLAAMAAAGVKAQQDVFLPDFLGSMGDYSLWKTFVDAGVSLLQTDYPHLLVPAAATFNATGTFPETGPANE